MKWIRQLLVRRARCSRQELAFLLRKYPSDADAIIDGAIAGPSAEAILRALAVGERARAGDARGLGEEEGQAEQEQSDQQDQGEDCPACSNDLTPNPTM